MAVRKLSIALEDSIAEASTEAAEHAGLSLSAWLNRAASDRLAVEAGLAAVREWEADHGPFTPAEIRSADRRLDRLGGKTASRTG